jgi:hypothetical protein
MMSTTIAPRPRASVISYDSTALKVGRNILRFASLAYTASRKESTPWLLCWRREHGCLV